MIYRFVRRRRVGKRLGSMEAPRCLCFAVYFFLFPPFRFRLPIERRHVTFCNDWCPLLHLCRFDLLEPPSWRSRPGDAKQFLLFSSRSKFLLFLEFRYLSLNDSRSIVNFSIGYHRTDDFSVDYHRAARNLFPLGYRSANRTVLNILLSNGQLSSRITNFPMKYRDSTLSSSLELNDREIITFHIDCSAIPRSRGRYSRNPAIRTTVRVAINCEFGQEALAMSILSDGPTCPPRLPTCRTVSYSYTTAYVTYSLL